MIIHKIVVASGSLKKKKKKTERFRTYTAVHPQSQKIAVCCTFKIGLNKRAF